MRILGPIARKVFLMLFLSSITFSVNAQCTWYTITVTDGVGAPDVTWELIDEMGVAWTSGNAPWEEDICLPDGCYTLLMYDSNSDGWDDINWFIEDWIGEFDWDTNLPDGPHGTDTFVLGDGQPCDPANGGACPPGTTMLQLIVTNGTAPAQVSWDFTWNGTVVQSGGAGYNDTLCLGDGCYVLYMVDAAANGWNGATYSLAEFGGAVLYSGTLSAGGADSVLISIGGATCSWGGGGGPGPGPGGGCGTVVNNGQPGSDCPAVICVCDPFTFPITPNGFGSIDEIPGPGSISNPAFGGGIPPPPWGGTDYGCLYAGELNSSWILFTVGTSGNLGFSFGAGGQQVGYYDWAMWAYAGPATCSAIMGNTLPPVRCVWDAVPWGGAGLANTLPPGGDPGNYAPELPVIAGQQFIICMSNWSYVTANVTLDFFGTATISCVPVLPIELIDFAATCEGDAVLVRWNTATERNNDLFTVERSVDASIWAPIEQLPGAGNSQYMTHYEIRDMEPGVTVRYYRLRQTDFDGTSTYSSVVAVPFCGEKEVVRQWLMDASGRACGTWPIEPGTIATGIYQLRTEFMDGSSSTRNVFIMAP